MPSNCPLCTISDPIEPYAPVYSDVGYILGGVALETCVGRPLDEQFEAELAHLATGTSSAVPATTETTRAEHSKTAGSAAKGS